MSKDDSNDLYYGYYDEYVEFSDLLKGKIK